MQAKQGTFRRLMDNFLSLTALQAVNYIVPLVTFPYLVQVLGADQFGLFSFVMAVVGYGVIITDYGFDLSATKHISTNSHDKKKIDEIFSAVIMIKSMMSLLFFLFLLLLISFVDKFSQTPELYLYAFGLVIGQVLFPVWFFQGIEKMRYITILNAIAKMLFAGAIFLFVHKPEDLYLVLIFNAVGAIVAGILAFRIAVKKFGVTFALQSKQQYYFYLKDAWHIFTSRVAVQLYQSVNIVILGFFVNNTVLGYYAIAEKIVRAGGSILVSIPRAVYPYMAKLYKESKRLFYTRNIQLSIGLFLVMAPFSALVYHYAPEILSLISGAEANLRMVGLLHILAPLFAVVVFGSLFTNILVILDETKLLSKIIIAAGLFNLAMVFVVIEYYSVEGLAWLNLIVAFGIIVIPKGYFIFFKFKKRDLNRVS